ncbi:sugar ABC transporter permease [Nostocoides sp. Soil756]|uniref:carbohydrate ABC transporter permease n=1 Tax=Nostocoides sp. Soil756 TaxID=1736399 RepID=UPI0006FC2C2D|nr:sugar ABC transporter permease [Tetrasphaera sp. Soil756]KRE62783.1 ABC transporter permease [Tetrasphaera sp. Soil756]
MSQASAIRRRSRTGDTRAALLFLLPFSVLALVFILYPVVQALYMGFFDWDLLTQRAQNFGLQNYVTMLGGHGFVWSATHMLTWRVPLLVVAAVVAVGALRGRGRPLRAGVVVLLLLGLVVALGFHPGPQGSWNDPRFWAALQHTIEFTVISTPLLLALGLAMALAVNRPGRAASWYRGAFFLPYVLPVSVVTLIWIYLYNPSRGLFASVTSAFGVEPIDYLNSSALAIPAVVLTTVWWTVGFNMVLFVAGLQDIEPSLYEAASLDGAGRVQSFLNITLPGLRRVMLLVLVTQVVASFQVFGQIYLMTRGGPGDSSLVLIQHIYQSGIRDSDLGYASAMSIVLLVLILAVSLVQLRFFKEDDA